MLGITFFVCILFTIVGCSSQGQNDNAFEEAVIQERIEAGVDGVNIIDLVENENDGVAFYTTYKGSEDNVTSPSLAYFEKIDNKWERGMGTTCEKEWQVLGTTNALYCGAVPDGFDHIIVNGEEASVFEIHEKLSSWYLITDGPEYAIKAVAENGYEQYIKD